MARKLRSSSRPSTPFEPPAGATTRPSSAADVSRPRKLRRTGLSSRVASDPPQGSQSQSEQAGPEEHDKPVTGWIEPPLRPPQPSYMDTPWSAMSSVANPVLASMRPLGSMPTAADFRKVGLEPRKSKPKRVAQPVQNGAQDDASGQNGDVGGDKTPENAVEGTASAAAPASPEHGTQKKDHLNTFATVPLPASAEFDVDKIKGAIEDALRKSIETGNQAVARALLHVWENTTKDNSTLSILDGMCRETPTINETSAFKTAVRSAWDGFQADDTESDEQPPAMTRTHSASSVSSLSPAKSLDADTFAPGVSTNTRSRTKGKQPRASKAKAKAPAPAPPPRRSLFPSMTERSQQRRRLMDEDPDFSDDALAAKREHLQKDLPELDVPESKIRGSLAKSNFSGRNFGSRATSGGARVTGRESRESSEAPDNRRLTSSDYGEESENNDYCHNCNKSGQLLCCDGCVRSFHFSCLDPPLDPADPPEGEWYCPKCSISRPFRSLLGAMNKRVHDKDFTLASDLRDYFEGVGTSSTNRYEAIAPSFPRIAPRTLRGSRLANYDDPNLRRLYEKLPNNDKETLIFCVACGKTSLHGKPVIQCDFCPCSFHMDCTDPMIANPPSQTCLPANSNTLDQHKYWMCPNHAYHDLSYLVHDEDGYDHRRRIRSVRRPRLVDIEVLPDADDEDARMQEITHEGEKYRVSERGVKLNFIEKVKRDHIESEAKKRAAERYFAYAKEQLDNLTAGARSFYENQRALAAPVEGTPTEQDAALSLLSLSHGNSSSTEAVQSELDSLRSLQESIGGRIQRLKVPRVEQPRVQEVEDDEVPAAQDAQNVQDGPDGQKAPEVQEIEMAQDTQEV